MPTLHWIGKEKVINHHLDVPFRVLEHKYGFSGGEVSNAELKSGNKIIHGDNLEALKALLPEYEGRIKCIYNDNVNDPKLKKWLHEVVGREGDDLSRHDKWLCMMYPRLKLLHKLLADDGTIFISLDEVETTHLRCLMNEIFGETNFIAQVTLLCNPKGRSQDKYFSTNHEYVTIYSKTKREKDSYSIIKNDELIEKEYKFIDEGGRYRLLELRNTHREFNKENRPNLFYPFYVDPVTGFVSLEEKGNFTIPVLPVWPDGAEGCWTWGVDLAKKDNHLLIAIKTRGNWKVYRKSYSTSADGENVKKKLFTIWQDPKFYTEKGQVAFGELFPGLNKNDFPQPKSVDLVMEIIRTCTSGNDIILDSFAGSGTTAQAVLNLNRQHGGERKFILIEMMEYSETITAERIKRVINSAESQEKQIEAFDFYTLGDMLFTEDGSFNENISLDKIRRYIYYTETRTYLNGKRYTDNPSLLGLMNNTAYYLHYEAGNTTTLNHEFLSTIQTKAENYIIYADNCLLTKEYLSKRNISFKKIPRDITLF
jgi:adenine-specific DNA-methyltransferase